MTSMITDFQNVAGWTAAQRARRPDWWLFGPTSPNDQVMSIPGKRMMHFQPAVLFNSFGQPAGPYNEGLAAAAGGAVTKMDLHGGSLLLIDLSQRNVGQKIAAFLISHFPTMDGWNFDYWGSLWWAFGDVTPTGESPDVYWPKYCGGLVQLVASLRAARPSLVITGQQFQLANDNGFLNAAINGLYLEQYPDDFNYTKAKHKVDKDAFAYGMKALGRTPFWICELRYPTWLNQQFGPNYCKDAIAWAAANDIVVSYGFGASGSVPPS